MRFDPPAALLTGDTYCMPWFTQQAWGTITMQRQSDGSWSRQVNVLAGTSTLTVR
jgi:hypothetical protein